MARALRTALTKYNNRLRVVFTGSSRTQLGHVFTDTRAPLYSAGRLLRDFPLLDDDFVAFVADRFAASTGRTLDLGKAKTAFKQFHHRPEPLLEVAVTLMMQPKMSFAKAVALHLDKQRALGRLQQKNVVSKSHRGLYEFENENFAAWVRNMADAP